METSTTEILAGYVIPVQTVSRVPATARKRQLAVRPVQKEAKHPGMCLGRCECFVRKHRNARFKLVVSIPQLARIQSMVCKQRSEQPVSRLRRLSDRGFGSLARPQVNLLLPVASRTGLGKAADAVKLQPINSQEVSWYVVVKTTK